MAGAVSVLPGSAGGLTATGGLFTHVGGTVEANDQFGSQLAAGDFNHNGFAELAAAPSESLGTIPEAGAVSILQGSAGGLTATGAAVHPRQPRGPWVAEAFDSFGASEFTP